MKQPEYDSVLLTGSDEELNEYIENSGRCLVVDWRSDEGALTDALAGLLPAGWLSHDWANAEGDMYVTYRGVRHKVGLTLSPADRYVWLRRMNAVMTGEYELRGFRHTLGDDTHCFLLARCGWWAAMEVAFPTDVRRVFARITRRSKFPEQAAEPAAAPDRGLTPVFRPSAGIFRWLVPRRPVSLMFDRLHGMPGVAPRAILKFLGIG